MTATAEARELAAIAARAAAARKAENVVVIDVSEPLVITDLFVIASADNERLVNAITEEIEDRVREAGHQPLRREGTRDGRWALIDYGDVVVHVQHDDERDFYGLERLWSDCPIVEIDGLDEAAASADGDGA
ncbi:ribosome silencing factor [Gordonia sp. (in: high G+C Gram-positive bacteria)]|uniref:ribosome silencing factor n=1 Tax=unclassified Gordonia (in: high G+C Gram-positive bacteria) TaxID=2657482 RepID=UPI002601C37F|nr:ribosome silencing factor [Gordonia sp. (in: high G+C Gram-positive bacteria)]